MVAVLAQRGKGCHASTAGKCVADIATIVPLTQQASRSEPLLRSGGGNAGYQQWWSQL